MAMGREGYGQDDLIVTWVHERLERTADAAEVDNQHLAELTDLDADDRVTDRADL
jgi:hypothetical protein